jgi:hypothetical protein
MVAGNLLFGHRMEEFSSLRMTCGTMFRMLYESEYRWQTLSEEHFATAAIYVWTYLIFVVFVMLNLVLAMILDTYNEVRMNTDSADTIFVFLELTMKRLLFHKRWVTNSKLQGILTEMDEETIVTQNDLLSFVPRMTRVQQDVIFQATKKETFWKANADLTRPNVFKLAASVKMQVDETVKVVNSTSQITAKGLQRLSQMGLDVQPADALLSALRQHGHSRPFPGMPDAPGGYNPPLVPPALITPYQPNGARPPPWLQDLRRQTEQLGAWMVALQWQMSGLQWKFARAHQLIDSEASLYESRDGDMEGKTTAGKSRKSIDGNSNFSGLSWNGPLKTRAGEWLL